MNEARVGDFVEACITHPDEARRLFAADPTLLQGTWAGDPLLHWFVIEDFQAAAGLLLEFGFPVDARDEDERTALHCACLLGRLGIVRMLLKLGADANAPHEPIWVNPLHIAVGNGHADITILLLEYGARVDYFVAGYQSIFSALQHVSESERPMFVQLLARHGVTREGLFEQHRMGELHDSPEQAFGW
ncbi:MAG: ankyrin repeat domain-containing protein [Planctomycetes bacterium]|nr:ankyrin repeat domain-containing protein [Planctomycetota bacterium]